METQVNNNLYNPHLGKPADTKAPVAPASNAAGPAFPFGDGKVNYAVLVFYLLMDSMQIRQNTVMTQSKDIASNASAQNALNNRNASIKFSILPDNAGNATINRVQEINQQYAAVREDIQNNLITARQTAQVLMTQTSTNVNILQQDASEDSGWLQTLNTIFQVINEMTQR